MLLIVSDTKGYLTFQWLFAMSSHYFVASPENKKDHINHIFNEPQAVCLLQDLYNPDI